jgi:putative MATE family efflux protein
MRNMTEGSIPRHLLSYAVPTILGNLLQLTYNAVDSIVVGKFAGENALAAVSAANPVMSILILGVSGLSLGASVLMSRFFGAGDGARLKRELATTILFGALLSLGLAIPGFLLARPLLALLRVPDEALGMAAVYLRIIFLGFFFTFQYNIMAGALRSVGDARTPVVYLGIASALNALFDVLLIGGFHLGVAGAALATVFAEGLAAALCFLRVRRTQPGLRLGRRELAIDRALLAQTLKSGSLTALQQAGQPIGKLLIQSVINAQGVAAIAAFNAVCRLDDFACIPAQSIGHSIMTCTAQNRGAGNPARVRESFRRGLTLGLCYYPVILAAVLLLKEPFVRLLAPDKSEAIVRMGVAYLSVKAWFYLLPCVLNAIQGWYRGLDRMALTLAATLLQISVRTALVYLWVPSRGITGEAWACLAGWLCQFAFEYGLYFRERRRCLRG